MFGALDASTDTQSYNVTFDNRVGGTPITADDNVPYAVSEHILWAPRRMRVASIGAGASGIMLCYKKEKEFGDDIDLVVYERYPKCGGVWYANKYPGCRCDVPSAAYQYPFAPKPDWTRFYSPASEIQEYYQAFAEERKYIGKYIKLRHEVTRADWDEKESMWRLTVTETTSGGEKREFEDSVDVLVGNIGVLNTWKWPDIAGRERFRGTMTHSADYDTSIDLKDKRVAVIGSGASSLQILPAVVKEAKEVVSFYRTPQWITGGMPIEGYTNDEGQNFDYSAEQKQKFKDDPAFYLEHRKKIEDNINTSFKMNIQGHPFQEIGRQMVEGKMREKLAKAPSLQKQLIPDFAMGCRRLGPGDNFLEAFVEGSAVLAQGDITSFTETGIKTTTNEYDVDIIICATGFDVSFRPYFPIIGRNNASLADTWAEDPEAYFALAAHGFPNFFIGSLGPNCPAGHGSFITVLETAQNYICKIIRKMQTENIRSIDVKASAVAEYNIHVHEWLKRS
ncbi:FAD/NAD(P)-binding domain-containing protein [Pyrenochaeta sp. DS3sAY3a]|nr:FAD/NAD(P)-binding domain-containing protein [Pyrenochaeta sp. DS3sAY3a]